MGKRPAQNKRVTSDEAALAQKVFSTSSSSARSSLKRTKQANTKLPSIQPAWVDEDDANVEVSLEEEKRLRKLRKTEDDRIVSGPELQARLKKHFQGSSTSQVAWADPKNFLQPSGSSDPLDSDDEDSTDALGGGSVVQSTSKLLAASEDMLPPGTLEICRMKDANQHAPSNAVIQSVQFHPNGQLLLTAGLDKTLHLFQIDGTTNQVVENIFVKELPMMDAKFTLDGRRIVLTGPRAYFYSYDMDAGRVTKIPHDGSRRERAFAKCSVSHSGDRLVLLGSDGYMNVRSARSYESIANLKMNGQVKAATFCDHDRYLLSTGTDGQIYKWDMRTRKCVYVHRDEGSLGNEAIAASHDGRYYAAGSTSGVVNIYDNDGNRAPLKPRKALMQLTTQIDHLKFNPDGQILAMASRESKDALKFVHMPTMTVFANWPSSRTPLHYVSAMDFSPSSGYFACGNARGRVLLYRLTHYSST